MKTMFCLLVGCLVLGAFTVQAGKISEAMKKGTLQAQIPNVDLSQVSDQVKSQCHQEAVQFAGFDPYGSQAKTADDYKNEFATSFVRNVARQRFYGNSRGVQIQQNIEARRMTNAVQAHAAKAQNYVKGYKACLTKNGF